MGFGGFELDALLNSIIKSDERITGCTANLPLDSLYIKGQDSLAKKLMPKTRTGKFNMRFKTPHSLDGNL